MPPRPATLSMRWPAITRPMRPSCCMAKNGETAGPALLGKRNAGGGSPPPWVAVAGRPTARRCDVSRSPKEVRRGPAHQPTHRRRPAPGRHPQGRRGPRGQGAPAQAAPDGRAHHAQPAVRPPRAHVDHSDAMTGRTTFAAALAVCAIAAPAASAATPDLSRRALDQTDLPSGTSVLAQGGFPFSKGVPAYYRDFRPGRSSGFAGLESEVILFKNAGD